MALSLITMMNMEIKLSYLMPQTPLVMMRKMPPLFPQNGRNKIGVRQRVHLNQKIIKMQSLLLILLPEINR
jgi:hypothetical protein